MHSSDFGPAGRSSECSLVATSRSSDCGKVMAGRGSDCVPPGTSHGEECGVVATARSTDGGLVATSQVGDCVLVASGGGEQNNDPSIGQNDTSDFTFSQNSHMAIILGRGGEAGEPQTKSNQGIFGNIKAKARNGFSGLKR